MKKPKLTAVVWKENKSHVSLCPELDVSSYGRTRRDAVENLKEAVLLYLETAKELKISLPTGQKSVIPLKLAQVMALAALRNVNAKAVISFLKAHGFFAHRQKGSHMIFASADKKRLVVVPIHGNRSIPVGTVSSILRSAGLARKELEEFLGR